MAIEFHLAKAILSDYQAYLHDSTGQRECPHLDQVRVAHRVVTGRPTEGLETAAETRVLGYSRPDKSVASNVLVEDEASHAAVVAAPAVAEAAAPAAAPKSSKKPAAPKGKSAPKPPAKKKPGK